MENFNDILPGQYIWFSDEGNVGQYRIVDTDKKNNKLVYNNGDKDIEIPFDYKSSKCDKFYANGSDAFDNAREYANKYYKILNPGTSNTHIVYKSPKEISIQNVKQMLLD